MIYSIEFTLQAERDFALLDKIIARHVVDKIDWLSKNIESIIPAPLKGKFKGKYKLRVGDWRVIYSFNHSPQIITIYAVRHRSEVYKI
ncbi:MAG: type II toxin-antitoxin system RelE/ParE family toxin [Thermodesulfovibrionales bacterium]|nr:type II toxin-antitoxin system RelE/ParE family toxin [Thermodesulfovibrionales bacterium]